MKSHQADLPSNLVIGVTSTLTSHVIATTRSLTTFVYTTKVSVAPKVAPVTVITFAVILIVVSSLVYVSKTSHAALNCTIMTISSAIKSG